MAKSNAERSAKSAAKKEKKKKKKKSRDEEEIRLHCLSGTRQALAELMAWSGIEEQGEAITLMIYHLHALEPQKSAPLLTPPRHEITVSPSVARRLELACRLEESRSAGDDERLVRDQPKKDDSFLKAGGSAITKVADK